MDAYLIGCAGMLITLLAYFLGRTEAGQRDGSSVLAKTARTPMPQSRAQNA